MSTSEPIGFAVSLTRKDGRPGCSCSFCDGARALGDDACLMYGHEGGEDGIGWAVAAKVVVSGGGAVRTCGSKVVVSGTTEATVLVTARTTYRSPDPQGWCEETLSRAASKGYGAIRSAAVRDYASLFDRCRLELPRDRDLESLPTQERLARLREDDPGRRVDSTDYQIVRTLLGSLGEVGTSSIGEVAKLCGVSKSTLSRFVRGLGFDDYADFRAAGAGVRGPVWCVLRRGGAGVGGFLARSCHRVCAQLLPPEPIVHY